MCGQGHVTHFLKFGTLLLSQEWTKLDISNLIHRVCRWTVAGTSQRKINCPLRGRVGISGTGEDKNTQDKLPFKSAWQGHELLLNLGPPPINERVWYIGGLWQVLAND